MARDGVEGLDYLYSRGNFTGRDPGLPAVMLLDIKMPKLNGLEVLRQMKSDPLLKTLPVVMLTSSQEEPDLAASYALGANAYVVKPVDFQQFVAAVKQVGAFWAVLNEPPPSSSNPPMEPLLFPPCHQAAHPSPPCGSSTWRTAARTRS